MTRSFSLAARRLLAGVCLTVSTAALAQNAIVPPQTNIDLNVDASEVFRRIVHATMTIPVSTGAVTLQYPKWLPGEHGPTGPITDVAGLKIDAGGKLLTWQREPTDMYAFNVQVPAGVSSLKVSFDFLSPPPSNEGFTSGASASSNLAVLSWNQLILYPKGVPAAMVQVKTSLKLPEGWKYGTALPVASESGASISFQPVNLETLVDSPLNCGIHFKTVELAPNEPGPKHYLHIAAESEAAIQIDDATKAKIDRLVIESGKLFGARHYASYHFLFTLGDGIAHFGLEHHESSDNRTDERTLIDEDKVILNLELLSHEMVHSWNGKYRRPADLIEPDFQQPIRSNLLWVYEGLTQYLGYILAARSGMYSPEQARDELARVADWASHRQGRTWRPLEDTATAAQLLYESRSDWEGWRRSVDFYDEGLLLWLEADTIIREQTKGAKSLDDFCKAFHGGPSGPPAVVPYTFDDVVSGLNAVAPYDWKGFLTKRVLMPIEASALGDLNLSGWKLTYTDKRSDMQKRREDDDESQDLTSSIGLRVDKKGVIGDIVTGGPADKAGISPGVQLVAVNGLRFSNDRLRDAIKAKISIELLAENAEFYKTYKIDYADGERYPHLEQDKAKTDTLSAIYQPLAAPAAAPATEKPKKR